MKRFASIEALYSDSSTAFELASDAGDSELLSEAATSIAALKTEVDALEFQRSKVLVAPLTKLLRSRERCPPLVWRALAADAAGAVRARARFLPQASSIEPRAAILRSSAP